jgi:2-oxoglutarate/2-oxoacid ferredoxin oxidoreductase subunit alpha
MAEGDLEKFNIVLQKKYKIIQEKEQRYESLFLDDARLVLVAYGTMARIASSAVRALRARGKKVGLIRPVTLWPFPGKIFRKLTEKKNKPKLLVAEMSYGQMLEDVKLSVDCRLAVEFIGRAGGGIPAEEEIIKKAARLLS